MRHTYCYKLIGNLTHPLLEELKSLVHEQIYFECPDFNPDVIKVTKNRRTWSDNHRNITANVYKELSKFFDPTGNIGTNIACMYPNTYLIEHSDYTAVNYGAVQDNIIKIQIPIITNDKVAMMWRADEDWTFIMAHLVEGGIYIVDNVRTHSAVNLSDQNRYHLTIRFKDDSIRDFSILE